MIDYEKVGFKAGLEIHQQLDTGKLFSRTPSLLRNDEPDYEIRRKLHVVAGETGEVDKAVEYESELDREFIYQGYNDSISLVELDEEPPKTIDEQALEEALKIALLMNCEIYQTSQIMRKTVIDGSNTGGFQRTVLIGHDGFIETSFGKVKIESLALEEDSARPAGGEEDSNVKVYKLDRLGIPLVEISTSPDMKNPEQVKEAALKIGEILRVCKVKRGIGTIRQDVNISVKGHNRVEIKGFQKPEMMVITIDKEIERQKREIKEGKINGEVRGALEDGTTKFNRPMPGKARMYPETDLPLLKISRERINKMKGRLPKLKDELRKDLKKEGLNDELVNLVLDEGYEEFYLLMKVYRDANLVAKMISLWRTEISTKYKKSFEDVKSILNEKILEKILEKVNSEEIKTGEVKQIMMKIMDGLSFDEAIRIERMDDNSLEMEIRNIVKENPGLRAGAYMGIIISKLGSGVDKRKAMEILNKVVV